jgi:hypothetical protein
MPSVKIFSVPGVLPLPLETFRPGTASTTSRSAS